MRKENALTTGYVANYIGMATEDYERCERGEYTPNEAQLKRLKELYGCKNDLLGAMLPIVMRTVYPKGLLDSLKKVVTTCNPHDKCDYRKNMEEYEKIREALLPILKIQEQAFYFPNINLDGYCCLGNVTVLTVNIDPYAESLIHKAMRKQMEVVGWAIGDEKMK